MNERHAHPHELISAMIDGEIDARERALVESHLGECAECRVLAADLKALGEALGDDPVPPVPAGLASRIGWRLRSQDVARRRRPAGSGWPSLRMLTALGGVAAALVLAVLVVREGRAPWPQATRDRLPAGAADEHELLDGSGNGTAGDRDKQAAKKSESASTHYLEAPQQAPTAGGGGTAGGAGPAATLGQRSASPKRDTEADSMSRYGNSGGLPGRTVIQGAVRPAAPAPREEGYSPAPPAAGEGQGPGIAPNTVIPQEEAASPAVSDLGKLKAATGPAATREKERRQSPAAEPKTDRKRREPAGDETAAKPPASEADADGVDKDHDTSSGDVSTKPSAAAGSVPPADRPAPPPPQPSAPEAPSAYPGKAAARADTSPLAVLACPSTDPAAARRWAFSSAPLAGLEPRAEAELSLQALAARLGGSICFVAVSGGQRLLVVQVPVDRYGELRAGLASRVQLPSSLTPPPAEGYETVRAVVRPK